jgi:hypothetical protein
MSGILGVAGWQWLFIIEGALPILLGAVTMLWLPDHPTTAAWLSPAEKALAAARVPMSSSDASRERMVRRRAEAGECVGGYYSLLPPLPRPDMTFLGLPSRTGRWSSSSARPPSCGPSRCSTCRQTLRLMVRAARPRSLFSPAAHLSSRCCRHRGIPPGHHRRHGLLAGRGLVLGALLPAAAHSLHATHALPSLMPLPQLNANLLTAPVYLWMAACNIAFCEQQGKKAQGQQQ